MPEATAHLSLGPDNTASLPAESLFPNGAYKGQTYWADLLQTERVT